MSFTCRDIIDRAALAQDARLAVERNVLDGESREIPFLCPMPPLNPLDPPIIVTPSFDWAAYVSSLNPAVWYRFQESDPKTGGLLDSSGNARHATWNGGSTTLTAQQPSIIEPDGVDYSLRGSVNQTGVFYRLKETWMNALLTTGFSFVGVINLDSHPHNTSSVPFQYLFSIASIADIRIDGTGSGTNPKQARLHIENEDADLIWTGSGDTIEVGQSRIIGASFDRDSHHSIYLDGALKASSPNTTSWGATAVGASGIIMYIPYGYACEYIIFDRPLSDLEHLGFAAALTS